MSDNKEWTSCPSGTLKGIQKRQQQNDDGPVVMRRTAVGMLIAAGATALVATTLSGNTAQKISCQTALQLGPGHVHGELTEQETANLVAHLEDCPSCDRKIRQMMESARA